MNISIVRAIDHYSANKREQLKPYILETIGEIFKEDEDYLILRSVNCYDHDNPNDKPKEEFLQS